MNNYEELAIKKLSDIKGMIEYVSDRINSEGAHEIDKKEYNSQLISLDEREECQIKHMELCRREGYYE